MDVWSWSCVTVTLAYMEGWTDVRSFLNYGTPRARAFDARGTPLKVNLLRIGLTQGISGDRGSP